MGVSSKCELPSSAYNQLAASAPRILSPSLLPSLFSPPRLQCTPTSEDVAALSAYRSSGRPVSDLGDAERIMVQV